MSCRVVGVRVLIGTKLVDYVAQTSQPLPMIVESCVRYLNQNGLHHQGLFRVSGMKDARSPAPHAPTPPLLISQTLSPTRLRVFALLHVTLDHFT